MPISEVRRKIDIAERTFYRWKSKYGGMLPSDMKRLQQLEEENARLKKLMAELNLDMLRLQDLLTKKFLGLREAGCYAISAGTLPSMQRKICTALRINRGWHRRLPTRDEQAYCE